MHGTLRSTYEICLSELAASPSGTLDGRAARRSQPTREVPDSGTGPSPSGVALFSGELQFIECVWTLVASAAEGRHQSFETQHIQHGQATRATGDSQKLCTYREYRCPGRSSLQVWLELAASWERFSLAADAHLRGHPQNWPFLLRRVHSSRPECVSSMPFVVLHVAIALHSQLRYAV
jgi:hypothetical protein